MSKYIDLSIKEKDNLLKEKKITPTILVNECFERIEKSDLNAFITVDKEGALKRASELEKMEAEIGEYKEQDEDVLTYALFGPVAIEYFKRRAALRNKVDPDALDMKNKAYPV